MHSNLRKKTRPNSRINVITLGCSKNLVDSEQLLAQLAGSGLHATHEDPASDASTVVINTCGFIDRAKEESVNTILDYVGRKERGEVERVIVTGCLSQRYRDELMVEIPEVDAWFGNQEDLPRLVQHLGADYKTELLGERHLTSEGHYAYLKIAEGCNRPCSFCAIPLMRGKHHSRPIELLVREAGHLASRGVKELMLIAQDLTYYGIDLYGRRRLDDLLRALDEVEGLHWIRLHYAYPSGFPVEILPVMRAARRICPYLDMPLQHIADNVLRAMRRGIDQRRSTDLLARIRDEVPGIAIRTTLLTGHPGETEADHETLLRFVEQQRLDRLGVFMYSHEENTHAGRQFADEIPEEVKQRRHDEIMELQMDISLDLNRARIGQTLEVIIDRAEDGYYAGRTAYDSPEVDNEVVVHSGTPLYTGDICQVRITDALEYDLIGEVVPS
ncbi:MAG: 30S ribosomal protein S12 methylthiotransferase RimO [Bacteroidia bacterium]